MSQRQFPTIFHLFSNVFAKCKAVCVLIGGFAVNYYNPKIREYKDLPDIIQLVRINKLDVKDTVFKGLCLKYGTEELYNKIAEGA